MITLHFTAIDGDWEHPCENIVEAGYVFLQHLGSGFIDCSMYAVAGDGIVTCYAEGATLAELVAEANNQTNNPSAAHHAENFVAYGGEYA